MKSHHLYLKKIVMISFTILFFNCTSSKIELENAQSQNIEFLIEQATNLWGKRSDTNAVKQANYFLGLAYNVKKTNTEITDLYIKCLFFQGMFLEGQIKKIVCFKRIRSSKKICFEEWYFYRTSTKLIDWRFYFQNIISVIGGSQRARTINVLVGDK